MDSYLKHQVCVSLGRHVCSYFGKLVNILVSELNNCQIFGRPILWNLEIGVGGSSWPKKWVVFEWDMKLLDPLANSESADPWAGSVWLRNDFFKWTLAVRRLAFLALDLKNVLGTFKRQCGYGKCFSFPRLIKIAGAAVDLFSLNFWKF